MKNVAVIFLVLGHCSTISVRGQMTRLQEDICVYTYFVPTTEGSPETDLRTATASKTEKRMVELQTLLRQVQEENGVLLRTIETLLQRGINETQTLKISIAAQQTLTAAQQVQIGALMEENGAIKKQLSSLTHAKERMQDSTTGDGAETTPATNHQGGGVTYVRWGRTGCPRPRLVVYKGYVGGGHYTYKGSGSTYLCLPDNPQWGNYTDGFQNLGGYVYGTEYEFSYIFSQNNNGGQPLKNHDAPCAVCLAEGKSTQIMIPARRDCPQGWVVEYRGYLVSNYYNYEAQYEYVCLDEEPEVLQGSSENKDGALFYTLESACGALPCPPYVSGRELSCVVCTR